MSCVTLELFLLGIYKGTKAIEGFKLASTDDDADDKIVVRFYQHLIKLYKKKIFIEKSFRLFSH